MLGIPGYTAVGANPWCILGGEGGACGGGWPPSIPEGGGGVG